MTADPALVEALTPHAPYTMPGHGFYCLGCIKVFNGSGYETWSDFAEHLATVIEPLIVAKIEAEAERIALAVEARLTGPIIIDGISEFTEGVRDGLTYAARIARTEATP